MPFAVAGVAVVASFGALGLIAGLGPKFAVSLLHLHNRAVGGTVVFAMLAASALAQLGARHRPPRHQLVGGAECLAVGLTVLLVGVLASSLTAFLVGIAIAGVGQGLGYLGGQALLDAVVPADRRGGVMSAFFLVLYLATAASALTVGLASGPLGLKTATVVVTAVLVGVAGASLLLTLVRTDR